MKPPPGMQINILPGTPEDRAQNMVRASVSLDGIVVQMAAASQAQLEAAVAASVADGLGRRILLEFEESSFTSTTVVDGSVPYGHVRVDNTWGGYEEYDCRIMHG